MKTLAAGLAFVAVLILANVVGGGVFLVLWPIVRPVDDLAELVAGVLLGLVSVSCAFFFIAGAMSKLPRWFFPSKF